MIKKFVSLMLVLTIVLNFTLTVHADEQETCDLGDRIDFSQLPEEYKLVVDPDAIIYLQDDGSYDIYQNEPILEHQVPIAQPRVAPRYAALGGSYTDLENGWITSLTCVVYQTYLPRNKVDEWITDQVPGMRDYIRDMGIDNLVEIADRVLARFGYHISISAINNVIQGFVFVLNWLNFNQVKTASNNGQNGILIEYLTSIGSGNARVYSTWSLEPYVIYSPYGGNAVWHPGNYYVMP